MEDHRRETSHSRQVALSSNRLGVCVEGEARFGAVLVVKAAKDQNFVVVDLVRHGQVTRNPRLLVVDLNDFPDVLVYVVALADVRDLLRLKLDPPREDVHELRVKDAAGGRVSRHVQVGYPHPLVLIDVVVLARFIKVFGIIAADDVDSVFLGLVDRGEVRPGVVHVAAALEHPLLLDVLQCPIATLVVLVPTANTKQASVVCDDRAAKLGNVALKIDEVFGLLPVHHIVEVDVLVTPLEVVDDALVGQLFLHDKQILEKLHYPLIHVVVVELSDHNLLVFKRLLILID